MSLIQKYLDLGWEIIPIKPNEKKPYFKFGQYKNKKLEQQQILEWVAKFDNAEWALLTGKNNTLLLDFDDPNIFDFYFSKIFTKKVMRTPSGGISCLVKSTVIPTTITRLNGLAVDIKGIGQYAVIPSRDLTEEDIRQEEEEEKRAAEAIVNEEKLGEEEDKKVFIRRWLNFDEKSDDEFEDVVALLEQTLPKIEADLHAGNKTPSAIDWFKQYFGDRVKYEGHGYIQTNCTISNHTDNSPSLTIYHNGYHCFSCLAHGGLRSLMLKMGWSDEQIEKTYPEIKKTKKTITDHVLEIIENECSLIKDHNNNAYLKLNNYEDIGINLLPANSDITRYWIATTAERILDKNPPEAVLRYVMTHLRGKAKLMGERSKLYRRIGGDQQAIWYDIGNNSFIKITKDEISVLPECPLNFIKETNQGVQINPTYMNPQNVLKLFRVINCTDLRQQVLLITWLVNAYLPWAYYPILLLCGLKGSGKSFMARILKRLVDPVEGDASEILVNKPRDLNYLMGILSHNACGVLDNLSKIDKEMSDVLCQVVTGGVMPTRELYTTNDQVLIDIQSRLICTAINKEIFESSEGDLAERTVFIEIDRPEGKYVQEDYLVEQFDEIRAQVLGGILALVQGYLKEGRPRRGETSEFRMTTYASVGKYIVKKLQLKRDFDQAYKLNQAGMAMTSLDAEPITEFILWFAKKYEGKNFDCSPEENWGISESDLYNISFRDWITETNKFGMERKFPKSVTGLRRRIRSIEPDLKKIYGISVVKTGSHKSKKWLRFDKVSVGKIEDEDDGPGIEEERGPSKPAQTESTQANLEEGW